MAKKSTNSNETIQQLKGADRVRLRPAVIFGSDGIEGCQHSVFEILSNSIDEAREGYGDHIVLTRYLDKSLEVQDFGRGIPMDYNENEKEYNWKLLFCEMYAGGKYDNNSSAGLYEFSLGLNGLGLCATQYASEWMEAEVFKDGFQYNIKFKKGKPSGKLKKEEFSGRKTGTRIAWKPDLEVFTDIDIPLEYFQDILRRQAIVNNGLKFILRNQIKEGTTPSCFETYEYVYENGITDYLKENVEEQAFTGVQFWNTETSGRDRADQEDYKVVINAAVCFSNKVQMNYLKQNNKYNKSDKKISFQDIEDCLDIVISSFSTKTSYENQTKKAITNKFIQEAMTDFFKQSLEVYFIENKMEADKITDQVLVNMRSRVRAETTRQNLKKTLTGNMDMSNRVQKFVDCRSKDVERREVFIVEGDSALGACKQARDSEFQAVIPVRGKILNCLKADYNRIFKSDIITDLIKVLGCGVEVAVKEGKVFIAESPLYEIRHKDEVWFAYTEKEKTEVLEELGDKKYTIQRSKGLGENDADMMWLTTMNPKTRRLIQIRPTDAEATAAQFDMLLGDNLAGRKEHIATDGHLFLDMTDLS